MRGEINESELLEEGGKVRDVCDGGSRKCMNKKRGQNKEEGGYRGGSSRPGLLPARTRHDVRRGRGRPPQPVGGGCQGLVSGGCQGPKLSVLSFGSLPGRWIFLGILQYTSITVVI